jgi:hydrogenase maturation protease
MTRPIIIGFGNTLRGDDGAGVYAAERVAAEMAGVDVVIAHELTPDLAASLEGRELTIFVDASPRAPRLLVRELESSGEPLHATDHAVLPADIVSLCALLFPPAPRRSVLMEVPAFNCEFGETMTQATERMVDLCVEVIRDLVAGTPVVGSTGPLSLNSLPD